MSLTLSVCVCLDVCLSVSVSLLLPPTRERRSMTSIDYAIGVEHRNYFENELLSKCSSFVRILHQHFHASLANENDVGLRSHSQGYNHDLNK